MQDGLPDGLCQLSLEGQGNLQRNFGDYIIQRAWYAKGTPPNLGEGETLLFHGQSLAHLVEIICGNFMQQKEDYGFFGEDVVVSNHYAQPLTQEERGAFPQDEKSAFCPDGLGCLLCNDIEGDLHYMLVCSQNLGEVAEIEEDFCDDKGRVEKHPWTFDRNRFEYRVPYNEKGELPNMRILFVVAYKEPINNEEDQGGY